ncbi:Platinum sensitivity protein [Microsporum ferrugineum]
MAMSFPVPPLNDRKRVKVYELRNNDWFDRGTGFCTGQITDVRLPDSATVRCGVYADCGGQDEPKILVESEDQPDRMLLETRISREDGYQKQQETLIVWTEQNGTDMALSFQEAEGCGVIWDFVRHVQQHLAPLGPDDSLSDDALDGMPSAIMLPSPDLTNLAEIEHLIVGASATQPGRDAIARFVIQEQYIMKLLPLVSVAEDLEGLADLHRLCNIMKALILLNDNTIIEQVVSDPVISAVVGALEYDPDFPTHKANHRQYLNDRTRYKEVVPIKDPIILRKIRHTWRLQYLKDVVLARILDDPTFSVLNSLIFFNQVDIVQHLQTNGAFLCELFSLFAPESAPSDANKREDAVQFLHQCMSIAKNLQAQSRGNLFANLINHGLFSVIAFAVKHPTPALRTTGIDILMILLDHDPITMRGYMLKAFTDKKLPLTDTLIDLLHTETDLGVKNQLADALKILLDPQPQMQELRSGEVVKMRQGQQQGQGQAQVQPHPIADAFMQNHFDSSSQRLFMPLTQLAGKPDLSNLSFQEVSLFAHLVEILTFFVRQHPIRSRSFIREEALIPRVAQLFTVPQKHLKLMALKFFRTLVSLHDTFYHAQLTHNNTFDLILNIVYETMPRDNLLNSACLDLFEFIKRENIKPIIAHVVERYREKIQHITYVDTFQNLILRYDQMQGYGTNVNAGTEGSDASSTVFSQDEAAPTPTRMIISGGQRWGAMGVREMDAAEEEYFETSDDEDDEVGIFSWEDHDTAATAGGMGGGSGQRTVQLMPKVLLQVKPAENTAVSAPANGAAAKPLVDYPDDDDDDDTVLNDQPQSDGQAATPTPSTPTPTSSPQQQTQLGRYSFSEKRRRQDDDDDDELIKLSSGPKRRNSVSSSNSVSPLFQRGNGNGRGKRGLNSSQRSTDANNGLDKDKEKEGENDASKDVAASPAKKIAINLNVSTRIALKSQDSNGSTQVSIPATATKQKDEAVTAPIMSSIGSSDSDSGGGGDGSGGGGPDSSNGGAAPSTTTTPVTATATAS